MIEGIILSIIFSLIGVWLLYDTIRKIRAKQQPTPTQQPQPAGLPLKSRIFGAAGSLLSIAIGLFILAALLWPTFGPADKVYTAKEFSKVGCTAAVLSSSGCTLSGTEKMSIAKIVVVPESLPTGMETTISIGSYQFKQSSKIKQTCGLFRCDDLAYYTGEIFQGQQRITYTAEEPGKPSDAAKPITVLTNRWYSIPVLAPILVTIDPYRYPEISIGSGLDNKFLADGLADNGPPIKGAVMIKSVLTNIKEVDIYYGSLLQTIGSRIGIS